MYTDDTHRPRYDQKSHVLADVRALLDPSLSAKVDLLRVRRQAMAVWYEGHAAVVEGGPCDYAIQLDRLRDLAGRVPRPTSGVQTLQRNLHLWHRDRPRSGCAMASSMLQVRAR